MRETPAVAGERFLFLGGLHKSGTSILHRLLRAHPDISGFADTGFPQDEGQLIQSVYPPAWAYGGAGRFAFDPRSRLTEESELVSAANAGQLIREWGVYFDLDRRILLEKSPPNIVHSRFLQALFPGARFVFIVRHPVPVAFGTLKWAKTSIVDVILHWCEAHRILLEDFGALDRAIILRYEDFVSEPERSLKALFEFADLPEFPLAETVSDHNAAYLIRWRSEGQGMTAELHDRFQKQIGICEHYGYRLSEPYARSITALGIAWQSAKPPQGDLGGP